MASEAIGRGRSADHPQEIPAPGWRDIAWRIWHEFNDDRVLLVAAGATFYVLLSFIPALAALVALYGLVFDPPSVMEQLDAVAGWVPGEVRTTIQEQLIRLTSQPNENLGLAFAGTLALSLWSASGATKAIIDGLNIVNGETEKRSFVGLNATALAFTLAGIIGAIAVVGTTIALPVAISFIWPSESMPLAQFIPPLILGAAIFGALVALYRWAPSRNDAKFRWLVPGAVVAIVLLALVTALFSWYARNFAAYSAYGSIGSAIAFMTWVWITLIVLLLGGEINAEMEHQTARDSTVGPPNPMGLRGAVMADTIGVTADEIGSDAPRQPLSHKDTADLSSNDSGVNPNAGRIVVALLIGAALFSVLR